MAEHIYRVVGKSAEAPAPSLTRQLAEGREAKLVLARMREMNRARQARFRAKGKKS